MSLNGFLVRAGGGVLFPLAKLIPSFGFGGGGLEPTPFAGCSKIANAPLYAATLEEWVYAEAELVDTAQFAVALNVGRTAEVQLADEPVLGVQLPAVDPFEAAVRDQPAFMVALSVHGVPAQVEIADEAAGEAAVAAGHVDEVEVRDTKVGGAEVGREECDGVLRRG